MPKGKATQNPSALRRKVARTAEVLDGLYGKPKWTGGGAVLDSLIGCILSQNTSDSNSRAAWQSLKNAFPTWEKAAAAPRGQIEKAIRVGGLGASKSRRIKDILSRLKRSRGEYSLESLREMPDDEAFDYLTRMNGVGKKTAAVVLLFACGREVFPVDTHVHRICRRLGFAPEGSTRDGVFEAMQSLVPDGKAFSFHVNLIRFGRDRCTKRNPDHDGCPLKRGCLYARGEVAF